MSSTLFSFIPRKVASRTQTNQKQNVVIERKDVTSGGQAKAQADIGTSLGTEASLHISTPSVLPAPPALEGVESNNAKGKGKGKEKATDGRRVVVKYTDIDCARLICLAFSDYALWLDPDLRRALDPGVSVQFEIPYVSLQRVLKKLNQSYGIELVDAPATTEMSLVKALRKYTDGLLDVRLLLSEPPEGWSRSSKSKDSGGGYEICRKDWTTTDVPSALYHSKGDWDERTLYIERIPVQYRSIPGVLQFITELLEEDPSSLHPLTRIQGVKLVKHHQDKPDQHPTFKDFCLVTFRDVDDAGLLLQRWPWNTRTRLIGKGGGAELREDIKEALRFGFRVLKKPDWEKLREEYLAYRTRLVQEIVEYEDREAMSGVGAVTFGKRVRDEANERGDKQQRTETAAKLTAESPYPYGCLLFVRNVHPETNKTTLRTLFSSVLQNELKVPGNGLDYVDYNKSMDTCHLRLAAPPHADVLLSYFDDTALVQAHGLDDKGIFSVDGKPIVVEKVLGRKEEVYWERVPEKVRKQAVQKAIMMQDGEGGNARNVGGNADTNKQKKRRTR
ncbi:hypothetical protein AMATHDRAFT_7056 [Amanita thiersii Skay4041]|uniref:XRRM domain-containing protein n=1 Tax=Amanita thiersii Skay4041 TaxID=703135 RepID=A0A2A9NH68_9AGAR|nr:hypothetical protein AMATHDRAFT_7056 [Amanita thiersii Skay4041]